MCRVLGYLGRPLALHALLFDPDNSLIRQSYAPRLGRMLNLAGFGLVAWDRDSHAPDEPWVYRTTELPVFDRNLRQLTRKLRPESVIAHVRGVPYESGVSVTHENLHPFLYDGTRIAFAHNGHLERFDELRFELLPRILPVWQRQLRGNTDSEWLYAVFLSQLDDPTSPLTPAATARAVEATLRIVREARARIGHATYSPVNLFIGDGSFVSAVRFAFDYGCYPTDGGAIDEAMLEFMSLWYTCGREYGPHDGTWRMTGGPDGARSIIVSSEPLSTDGATWLEVPEYSMVAAVRDGDGLRREAIELDA